MTIREKILEIIPRDRKFSAVEIAEELDLPIKSIITRGWQQRSSPAVTRILTDLCKEDVLYQWVIAAGNLSDLKDNASKWELYFVHREGSMAKELLEKRKKYLRGYRFR